MIRFWAYQQGHPGQGKPACGRPQGHCWARNPHVMARLLAVGQSILPGVSSLETVRANHALALDPASPRSNPTIATACGGQSPHEDMCEAAHGQDSFCHQPCDEYEWSWPLFLPAPHASWLAALRATDKMYEFPIDRKRTFYCRPGGYQKICPIIRAPKPLTIFESGLKPGGTLLL